MKQHWRNLCDSRMVRILSTTDNVYVGIVLSAIIASFCFLVPFIFVSFTDGDPDRFYHYFVSKLYSLELFPQTLAQAENVGWDKIFQEKEFLFHVLTSIFYRINGVEGITDYVHLQFAVLMTSIFWIASKFSKSWLTGLIISVTIILTSHYFPFRMMFVRPHVLAVLFYCWLLWSAVERRHVAFLIFTALYILSYHTIYIPIMIFACRLVAELITKREKIRAKEIGLFFLTILTAVIVNPYFPSNIMLGLTHLRIALQNTAIPLEYFGAELLPLRADNLLKEYGPFMLIGVGLIILIPSLASIQRLSILDRKYTYTLFLGGLLAVWTTAIMLSPRSSEYLIPTLIFFFALASKLDRKTQLAVFILLAGCFVLRIKPQIKLIQRYAFEPESSSQEYTDALATVPIDQTKNKIFNCNWSAAPFILHFRSDLRFIDLLDPTFLLSFDKERSDEKWSLFKGELPDATFHLLNDFKSDYVYCESTNLSSVLFADPEVTLLYPHKMKHLKGNFVFKMPEKKRLNFATKLSIAYSVQKEILKDDHLLNSLSFTEPKPLAIDAQYDEPFAFRPRYFYLEKIAEKIEFSASLKDSKQVCLKVEPTSDFFLANPDAKNLGVGFSGYAEVWLDNKLLYKNWKKTIGRLINRFIELDQPLSAHNKLTIIVCDARAVGTGIALSLWNNDELNDLCKKKLDSMYTTALATKEESNDLMAKTCGIDATFRQERLNKEHN